MNSDSPATFIFRSLRSLINYNKHLIAGYRETTAQISPLQWRFRLWFIGIALVLGAYVAYAFGEAMAEVWSPLSKQWAGMHTLLMVGTGWILDAILSRWLIKPWLEYWGHLATTMLAGVLMFFPWQLLHWILSVPWPFTLTIGASVSFVMMAWLHYSRVKLLELPRYWTAIWGLLVMGGLVGWGWLFYGLG